MSPTDKRTLVKRLGERLGFARVGVARAGTIRRAQYLREWVASGRAGEMGYLGRNEGIRVDPRELVADAKSVVVAAMTYRMRLPAADAEQADDPRTTGRQTNDGRGMNHRSGGRGARGRVAMYAWGEDYHVVVKSRLHRLVQDLREETGEDFRARVCVDTVPVLEREWAELAGVGWIGKNTLVMHESLGSYFFLGLMVTTLDIASDEPVVDRCGSCTRCLDACPTEAFPKPYEMDASRCVSYLTIEHRSRIPESFHAGMGDWLFGCDVCQEVCPYNRDAPMSTVFAPGPAATGLDAAEVAGWSDEQARAATEGSAMDRARPEMLRRNAAIVLKNAAAERSGSATGAE